MAEDVVSNWQTTHGGGGIQVMFYFLKLGILGLCKFLCYKPKTCSLCECVLVQKQFSFKKRDVDM